jgi:anti-sigma regulatory factor (Ser/Thr protein kinase)
VTQAVGAAGFGLRQAIAPGMLPRSQPGEFELVLLDLDVDAQPVEALLSAVGAACPDTPIVCMAGKAARERLIQSLADPTVAAIVPKLGSWLESQPSGDGPDEQELAVALRRFSARMALGPSPYLLGGTPIEERLLTSIRDKDGAVQAVLQLGERLGLSEEKLRRVEIAADELTMNALHDAPRAAGAVAAGAEVRLRFGADARTLALSVDDKHGSITRDAVVGHIARVLEAGGPRPRPVGATASGGAGLGLVLTFTAVNQLVVASTPGKFTEVTAVLHLSGLNRTALARGSALHLYL